jgi:flagellum-specific peptidoglycan hydrolase FlgJ
MASPEQLETLRELYQQAVMSQHIWPEMAACEAALESGWLTSELARDYNNLFGQKQSATPEFHTVKLPTQEYIGPKPATAEDKAKKENWVRICPSFVWFPTKTAAFTERMSLLERLQTVYPEYKEALHAATPEDYISSVSKRWSTDPDRAKKVLQIYQSHKDIFAGLSSSSE